MACSSHDMVWHASQLPQLPDLRRTSGVHDVVTKLLQQAQTAADMPALAPAQPLPMAATRLENTFTCQPQQRNMHGRIFGGFLMR